jgi:hypothetical protein
LKFVVSPLLKTVIQEGTMDLKTSWNFNNRSSKFSTHFEKLPETSYEFMTLQRLHETSWNFINKRKKYSLQYFRTSQDFKRFHKTLWLKSSLFVPWFWSHHGRQRRWRNRPLRAMTESRLDGKIDVSLWFFMMILQVI